MCILSLGMGVTAQKMGSVTFFCVTALPSVRLQRATLYLSVGSLQEPRCTCPSPTPPWGTNEFPSAYAGISLSVLQREHCSYLDDSEYSCMWIIVAK